MTNNEDIVAYADRLEADKKLLRELQNFPSGQALIRVLQDEHDLILKRLIATPATEVHRVADAQGRYHIINILLNRILEDDNADEAS